MTIHKLPSVLGLLAFSLLGLCAPSALAQTDAPMPNPPQFPDENPPLLGQSTLGKLLFFEEQLSFDSTMACGTCHRPESGGSDPRAFKGTNPGPDGLFGVFLTDDDVAGSPSVVLQDASKAFVFEGTFFPGTQATNRKAPSIINAVYHDFSTTFWDGRGSSTFLDPSTGQIAIAFGGTLESATAEDGISPQTMGAIGWNWDDVAAKLADATPMSLATNLPLDMLDYTTTHASYPDMFNAVYGTPTITPVRIIFAISNYMRTQISDETLLDDFLKGIIPNFGFDPELQLGFDLFQGNADCASCHTLPFTMDSDFHNIGVRPDAEDSGLMAVTGNPFDNAKFKTPNIRNAKLRGTLFHSGDVSSVTELVEFYNDDTNKFTGPNTDTAIFNLYLSQAERLALVRFIEDAMTDARVENGLFPFDRPTLRSELPPNSLTYGVPSPDGQGDFAAVISNLPPSLNNQNFLLGVADATPNVPATLLFAFQPDPLATPFPNPLFPVPVNVDLGTLFLVVNAPIDTNGVAGFNLPISGTPVLAGMTFYTQWFIFDPAAVATGGVYGSHGLQSTIF